LGKGLQDLIIDSRLTKDAGTSIEEYDPKRYTYSIR
jgi:hypothetical protein